MGKPNHFFHLQPLSEPGISGFSTFQVGNNPKFLENCIFPHIKSIPAPRAVSPNKSRAALFPAGLKELELNPGLIQHLLPAEGSSASSSCWCLSMTFLGRPSLENFAGSSSRARLGPSSSLKIQELKSQVLPEAGSFPLTLLQSKHIQSPRE